MGSKVGKKVFKQEKLRQVWNEKKKEIGSKYKFEMNFLTQPWAALWTIKKLIVETRQVGFEPQWKPHPIFSTNKYSLNVLYPVWSEI